MLHREARGVGRDAAVAQLGLPRLEGRDGPLELVDLAELVRGVQRLGGGDGGRLRHRGLVRGRVRVGVR
eukprot:scaffold55050_cov42-Phaeocystis_antarctica.AAC.1